MIDVLPTLLTEFPGKKNRMRCFAHILNLVAKIILRQFDIPKAKDGAILDEAAQAMADLAEEIEFEGEQMVLDMAFDDDLMDDDEDGMMDIREDMTLDEVKELEQSVKPVRMVLIKVR